MTIKEDDPDAKNLITPATTPGCIENGHYLTEHLYRKKTAKPTTKKKWHEHVKLPLFVIVSSTIQVTLFLIHNDTLFDRLRFDPKQQHEVWRFWTYMIVHYDWQHLTINIGLQCLFAVFLESTQGWWKVLIVYAGGGFGGALGAVCVKPELLVGASAGVYALLTSYMSYILLNLEGMKYKLYKLLSVFIIISSDVLYNLFHHFRERPPKISWSAHVFGATFGFLIGLIIYSSNIRSKVVIRAVFYVSLTSLFSLFFTLGLINLQLRKCSFYYKHSVYCTKNLN